MRAIQLTEFGGPEVLRIADVPVPEPRAGEVLIRVAASGVNYADTRMRAGRYTRLPELPATPGFEASGYVVAVGPETASHVVDPSVLEVGTAVVAGDARSTYAEFAIVPADLLVRIPEGKDVAEAAALPVNYFVAWMALNEKGGLCVGETVLVNAAGGGVGSAVVQLARFNGATVVAAASSKKKLDVAAAAGAHHLVDYSDGKLINGVRQALGSTRPIDLVVDSVGGQTLVDSLELLAPWGRLVGYGQGSDSPAVIDLYKSVISNHLDLRFLGRGAMTASRRPQDRARLYKGIEHVVKLWADGSIAPVALERRPLDDAAEVHRLMGERSHAGKFILDPEAR